MKYLKTLNEYHELVKNKNIFLKDLASKYNLKFELIHDMPSDKKDELFSIWREKGIEKEIDIKDLTFIQKTVGIDYIDKSYADSEDVLYIGDYIDEPVEVVQHQGDYYLMDGYHRTVWLLLNGRNKVKALLHMLP